MGKYIELTGEAYEFGANNVTISSSVRPTNTAVLYCIKYEPTYHVQYTSKFGYMKRDIIFDGNANQDGQSITLAKALTEYDSIEIYAALNISAGNPLCVTTMPLGVDCISYGDYEQFDIGVFAATTGYHRIGFTFLDANTLKILYCTGSRDWVGPSIYKIIGIKCSEKTVGVNPSQDENIPPEEIDNILNEIMGGE